MDIIKFRGGVILKIKQQNQFSLHVNHPKAGVIVDFTTLATEIHDAESKFNYRFKNKRITVSDIKPDHIKVLLETTFYVTELWREISAFSSYLIHDNNFDRFSSQPHSLFKIIGVTAMNVSSPDDKPFTLRNPCIINTNQAVIGEMSDTEAIRGFNSLIDTKEIGVDERIKLKKEAIIKIKNILNEIL